MRLSFAGTGFLLFLWLTAAVAGSDYRSFESTDGRTLRARILSVEGDTVRVERADGRTFSVPIARFRKSDRARIREWRAGPARSGPDAVEPETVNAAIGAPLFDDAHLWDDPAADAARRISCPRESETADSSSFRRYADAETRFLGARPFSVALYGAGGTVARLSLIFANKGDFFAGGSAPADMDGLGDAIERDASTLESALSELFGEGDRQSFGEGSGYRRVSRWDWRGHAFVLSEMEEEYAALAIMPEARADAKGRAEKISAKALRRNLANNVARNEAGDVWLRNIPMVDQGPKGYCVPATFERYMRYTGIPTDMYLLAMAGATRAGGGTLLGPFVEGVERDVSRYGRDLDRVDTDMEVRDIARHIDEGLPLLWRLHSTEAFNALANQQTANRQPDRDPQAWSRYLEEVRERAETLGPDPNYGHIAMIVGYNKRTGEIAISDSWGPRYERRWIVEEAAEAVDQGSYVIDF